MTQKAILPYGGEAIYIDTETIGLYGQVRLVQIYCPSKYDKVHLYDTTEISLEELLTEIKSCTWIGHNLIYDMKCLKHVPDQFEDTYLLSKLQYFDQDGLSLEDCLQYALGYNPYGDIDKKSMQRSDWTGELSKEQLIYAATDVFYLPELMEACKAWMDSTSYVIDKLTITHFARMKSGIPVDRQLLTAQLNANNEKIASLNSPINVNSHKQVKDFLGRDESCGDLELARLIALSSGEIAERAQLVRTVRSTIKQNSFIKKYLTLSERDGGYLMGHLNLIPRSGRSNASEENVQQIPGKLKHCFQSERFLLYSDYSALEMRMITALIGERTLEKLFRQGEDLHAYAAKQLFGADFTKDQRQIAKIYNFSSIYSASFKTIRDIVLKWSGVWVNDNEAQRNKARWLDAYPDIKAWQKKTLKQWERGETLHTILGRPYKAKLYTDACNIQNSGSAAEVAKLAIHYMSKDLDITKFLLFIHDSFTWEFDSFDEAVQAAPVVADAMHKAWLEVTQHCIIKDLPMPIQVSIDHNWKKADSDEAMWKENYYAV